MNILSYLVPVNKSALLERKELLEQLREADLQETVCGNVFHRMRYELRYLLDTIDLYDTDDRLHLPHSD